MGSRAQEPFEAHLQEAGLGCRLAGAAWADKPHRRLLDGRLEAHLA